MSARRSWHLLSDRRGVAALEFAVIGPLLLLIFGGLTDMGLATRCKSQLAQAVASGAQYAFKVGPTVTAASVQSMVQASTTLSGVVATVSGPKLGCVSGSPATLGGGTAGTACSDGTQPGTYVVIAATYTYNEIMPLVSTFMSTALQQSVTVRLQ